MKKRFKIIKYKSVTLIFISFLLLFLIEFLLRLLWTPAKVSCQFTDDLYLFWKGTPNYISERKNVSSSEKYIEIKLNSFGFRSPEFKRNKKPGTYRIVCMGDSTTNGFLVNIEDAYPSLLQSFLKKKYPNREIEV
ncbi:hypothetical protein KKB18_04300, partial [bacterium]|nr:hypothetical protein [bacterium]